MKKLIVLLSFVFCFTTITQAQNYTPEAFKYQGSITDNNNVPITNQSIGVEIKIKVGNPAIMIYTETHQPTTSASGTFNINIGEGTTTLGNFSTIDWAAAAHNIVISVDENGGTSYQLLGTSQLLSVPYALSAKNALRINDILVDAITPTTGQVLAFDGVKWSPTTLTFATIDDNQVSTTTVWSSDKTQTELNSITVDYANITNTPSIPVINDASTSTTEVLSAGKITSNYVTINTTQNIDGKKTFTDQVNIGEIGNGRELWIYRNGDFMECYDESGVLVGKLQSSYLSSTGDSYFEIEAGVGRKLLMDGDTYFIDKVEFDDDVKFTDNIDIYGYDSNLGQNIKRGRIYASDGIAISPEIGDFITLRNTMRIKS